MTKTGSIRRIDRTLVPMVRRWSIPVLRWALGITFIWFGALKVADVSPVSDMVASTVYFLDPDWFVPALGVVEIVVGIGLILRVWLRPVLAVIFLQLVGTFMAFLLMPDVTFQDNNPLLLTTEGEFIVKNLVLLGAAMVIGSQVEEDEETIPAKEGV
jgi:putative oxidoreductase